jgi:hypothetical protein
LFLLIAVEMISWLMGRREPPVQSDVEAATSPRGGWSDDVSGWNFSALNPLSSSSGLPTIDGPQPGSSILGGIVLTAEEVVRRQGVAFARAILHRVMGTIFALVDSVAAGQVAEPLFAGEMESFEG